MAVWLTIDEVAREAGTTVRSVRTYHERGLLPSPNIEGRTGYYDSGHLERLLAIARLLDQGFTFAAIKALFDAWERGDAVSDVLGFISAAATAHRSQQPVTISLAALTEKFPTGDADTLQASIDLGILHPTDDPEDFRVDSMRQVEITAELVDAGLPLARVLSESAEMRAVCDALAERFARIFEEEIWEPYLRSERTEADLERVTNYLRRGQSLPGELVGILVEQALQRALDEGADEMLTAVRERAHSDEAVRDAAVRVD